MGLIKEFLGAATNSISTVVRDQWKEYIYCDSIPNDTLMQKGEKRITSGSSNTNASSNIITNGSKIVVNDGQFMLIVENGKVVDFTAEPGAYTYDTGTEPSLFDTGFKGLKESFSKIGKRFTYGGQPESDQRVYYINTKEIINNKIGVGNIPFRDSEFNFTVKIMGYGTYSYKITNPLMFYANLCANVTDNYRKSQIDEQLKSEVQESLHPALARIAAKGIAYDSLTGYTKEIGDEVNAELTAEWNELRGLSVVSVAFSSITVDEESAKMIKQFQESRVYADPRMLASRLGSSQANAMEAAAKNDAGAMQGFLGMGMAMQQGGMNAAQLFNMADNQPQQAPQDNIWKCDCGTENSGKFCTECGKPKPEQNAWTCECGTTNSGKFCTECGKPKPNSEWVCECGSINTGKFCTECGKPRS